MAVSILNSTIEQFRGGRDIEPGDAEALVDAMIAESDEALLANVFHAWNRKGIAEEEIFAITKIMRERCTRVNSRHKILVDIVGTGGSKVKTFNVSTAAAFVVAGHGLAVAKHGNKAATSNSGSADVLVSLGVEPAVDAATAERCLEEIGICFMFAPNFHRLSPTLGKVRRGLGFPTIFNCVGPLCNPASATNQLIGVWSKDLVPKMANALARLETKKSWIVHGENGMDEISLSGKTFVAEVTGAEVRNLELTPEDFGVVREPTESLRVETPEQSAAIIRQTLEPNREYFAAKALVEINAAAAIFVSGYGENVCEAYEFASDSIRGGHAKKKLDELAAAASKQ